MSRKKKEGEPLPSGGQAAYWTPEELKAKVEEFFEACRPTPVLSNDGKVLLDAKGNPVIRDEPPTMAGLALFLGFKDRQSLYDYRHRSEGFAFVLDTAKTRVEAHHERLLTVKDRCTGSIIWLKNFGDYKDERTLSGGLAVVESKVDLTPDQEEVYRKNFALFFGGGSAKPK